MQVFNEENANLFVILLIKGLLVRTNVRNNRSSLWRDKNVSSRWATLSKSVGVLEITIFLDVQKYNALSFNKR